MIYRKRRRGRTFNILNLREDSSECSNASTFISSRSSKDGEAKNMRSISKKRSLIFVGITLFALLTLSIGLAVKGTTAQAAGTDSNTANQLQDPGHQVLPANDGWASANGGTSGGSAAASANIYTVTNREQLVQALGGDNTGADATPKIIYIKGSINGNEDDAGNPLTCADYITGGYSLDAYLAAYDPAVWGRTQKPSGALETARAASEKAQAARVEIFIPSNTTIIGLGDSATSHLRTPPTASPSGIQRMAPQVTGTPRLITYLSSTTQRMSGSTTTLSPMRTNPIAWHHCTLGVNISSMMANAILPRALILSPSRGTASPIMIRPCLLDPRILQPSIQASCALRYTITNLRILFNACRAYVSARCTSMTITTTRRRTPLFSMPWVLGYHLRSTPRTIIINSLQASL